MDQRTRTNLERLEALEGRVKEQSERIEKLERIIACIGVLISGGGADAASDRDLDSKYGNPEVRNSPRDWTGPSLKGKKYSECPPEFLDILAETFDYFEKKNRETGEKTGNGKLKADYDKQNARLARGWARRIRNGWKPPETKKPSFGSNGTNGTNGAHNPFANGNGRNPFGAKPPQMDSRETAPEEAKSSPTTTMTADDEYEESDADTSFEFGHNVSSAEEEEDMPPLA